jgi:hypothetical protein
MNIEQGISKNEVRPFGFLTSLFDIPCSSDLSESIFFLNKF